MATVSAEAPIRPRKLRRPNGSDQSEKHRYGDTDEDGLYGCLGGTTTVLLSDASRHHSGCGQTQADGHSIDDLQHGLGQPDCCESFRTQAGDEKRVRDGKERLPDHLENHWNGQERHGTIEASLGEILLGTSKSFPYRGPKASAYRRQIFRHRFYRDTNAPCGIFDGTCVGLGGR